MSTRRGLRAEQAGAGRASRALMRCVRVRVERTARCDCTLLLPCPRARVRCARLSVAPESVARGPSLIAQPLLSSCLRPLCPCRSLHAAHLARRRRVCRLSPLDRTRRVSTRPRRLSVALSPLSRPSRAAPRVPRANARKTRQVSSTLTAAPTARNPADPRARTPPSAPSPLSRPSLPSPLALAPPSRLPSLPATLARLERHARR